ncbi:hypothetical protein VTO73DRAFT_15136 [Trametes versicolor]
MRGSAEDQNTDFRYHYTNRFADRDIFVRYYGGGIGHARSSTGTPPSVLTAFDEEDFEWQDVDDPHQDDPGANVGEQSDAALEPSNDADRLRNIIPELVGAEIPMDCREDEEAVDEDKGVLPVDQQYIGQTQADLATMRTNKSIKVFWDGIPPHLLNGYQHAVQNMLSAQQPNVHHSGIRHPMEEPAHYLHPYSHQDGTIHQERKGVLHLVHAWTSQGHPNEPLHPSQEMRGGGVLKKEQAVRAYLLASRPIALVLAEMFKALFPLEYEEYRQAFDAGVWFQEDEGPWLGRAIVYKLDVNLHFDHQDGGPTATFPVGQFEGGAMEIPQLNARLE